MSTGVLFRAAVRLGYVVAFLSLGPPILGDACGFFIRGDANDDGRVDLSDGIFTLMYRFNGGRHPKCFDAADANDDGRVNIADTVWTLNFLFEGGPQIPLPWPDCGVDPTEDELTCDASSTCMPCRQPPSGNTAPHIEVVSPRDGEHVTDRVDVTVEFARFVPGEDPHTSGYVRRVELVLGGQVVAEFENVDRLDSGTHTFRDLDVSNIGAAAETVCIVARVFKASPQAMLCRAALVGIFVGDE